MKKILLVITVLFVFSCKSTIAEPTGNNYYFETPQPIDNSELSRIPAKFQGVFMSSDSTFLNIKSNVILSEHYLRFKIHKDKIDSLKLDFDYLKGTYISKVNHTIFETNKVGDSIELFKKQVDTLFIPSNSQKVKQVNNNLILNTNDLIYWKIRILSLEKNILILKNIYSDEDLKMIDKITKSKPERIDSSSFIIRPTRKEFKHILNLKKLGEEQQFKKVGK